MEAEAAAVGDKRDASAVNSADSAIAPPAIRMQSPDDEAASTAPAPDALAALMAACSESAVDEQPLAVVDVVEDEKASRSRWTLVDVVRAIAFQWIVCIPVDRLAWRHGWLAEMHLQND